VTIALWGIQRASDEGRKEVEVRSGHVDGSPSFLVCSRQRGGEKGEGNFPFGRKTLNFGLV